MRIWLSILLLALAMPARAADPAVVYANANGNAAKPYREGWFGTGDTKLHYVEAGQGPLILLVHGFPSFWFSWFDQMEALKGRYRVVAIDALGAGLSGKPQRLEPYRVENLAKQLDGLARHLNDKRRFVLVGHDWGAALAFAYAQAYPKRLNAVIGMSAPPYNIFLNLVRDSTDQQRRSTYMQTFRALTLADIEKRELAAQIWRQSYGGLIESGALSQAEGELFRAALSDPRAIDGGMNWYRANIPPFDRIGAQTYWPARNAKLGRPRAPDLGRSRRYFCARVHRPDARAIAPAHGGTPARHWPLDIDARPCFNQRRANAFSGAHRKGRSCATTRLKPKTPPGSAAAISGFWPGASHSPPPHRETRRSPSPNAMSR